VKSDDLEGVVHIRSHVRPLIVVDFDNEIVCRELPDHRRHTDIRRPISSMSMDAIAANAAGHEGRSGPVVVVEKAVRGRVAYQDVYTELLIGAEYDDEAEMHQLTAHRQLITRFLGAYRFIHPDPRVEISEGIPGETNPLRIGFYQYAMHERALAFEERMGQARPSHLDPSIVALGRGARALQDHVANATATQERAYQIGGFLINGFKLSENLVEIERLAELAFNQNRPRSAIVEAISILELGILSHRRRMQSVLIAHGYRGSEPQERTMQFVFNKVLPSLISLYNGDKSSIMRRANDVLTLRHNVVHRGYQPNKADANTVISLARVILSIFELPEHFRADWKLKEPP
jgi:hypothetical protein